MIRLAPHGSQPPSYSPNQQAYTLGPDSLTFSQDLAKWGLPNNPKAGKFYDAHSSVSGRHGTMWLSRIDGEAQNASMKNTVVLVIRLDDGSTQKMFYDKNTGQEKGLELWNRDNQRVLYSA